MGNICDELISEYHANMLAEGCPTHKHKYMSDDGHCLKCEDNNDIAVDDLNEDTE